jgi:hypothetical protein
MCAPVLAFLSALSFFGSSVWLAQGSSLFLSVVLLVTAVLFSLSSLLIIYLEKNGFVVNSADFREGLAALFNDVLSFLGVKKWVQLLLTFPLRSLLSTAISKLRSSTSGLRLSALRQ